MVELPTGTVTMLFSDIEGSTLLLSRIGPAYAEALDAQRRVLRKAWAEHGGTELGTEGDSFFVVFRTAPDAVAAATQAQRELAGYPWPGGAQVRVRMGIHTGSPTVHDGGYVGMDVHRAARIAGAAHGGQVVVSSATAELVSGYLDTDVHMRDLGSHQLKDIPVPEHLFQLTVDGLQAHFSPLKTLGAASSLPVPPTPLVGRDGELAELTALLRSPGVRLVTLTGPGGSGKTRLAIAVAQRLVQTFPDGVYFVPLAVVTNHDVMWTSIAEVLDVPPEGRTPPDLFTYVAHRSALFVLDNLEQLSGADGVVAELMDAAPEVVMIATSRRPLNITGELQRAVPPLELPGGASVQEAQRSGAVQLFVQHARTVKATFTLDADNVVDVVAVCNRLDGLPLALVLAAARSKFLSPRALLTRLDQVLDITASGSTGPSRQKTLRDTIAWSYDLLTPEQQAFFRRLGVFAGGADLHAIAEVTLNGDPGIADPLDRVADLVDASLAIITQGEDGEPRFDMLETIRAYAIDQLRRRDELERVRLRHAQHYVTVVGKLSPVVLGSREEMVHTQSRFERELDNFREALRWALQPDDPDRTPSPEQVGVGLRLCADLRRSWGQSGRYAEGRRWLERVINLAGDDDSVELGACYWGLAALSLSQGDRNCALEITTRSVAMWRRLGDSLELSSALTMLGIVTDDRTAARHAFEEAATLAREAEDGQRLADALANLSDVETAEGNYQRALALRASALDLYRTVGNDWRVLVMEHNIGCLHRQMGRPEEARRQIHKQIPRMLELADPASLLGVTEDYGAVLADSGDHEAAARLFGAAQATRERTGVHRDPILDVENDEPFARARAAIPVDAWDREYQLGYQMTIEAALTEAYAAYTPT
jgi:predicted ATPase/class 3 adenylate cyclase